MPGLATLIAAVPLPMEPKGTPGHAFTTTDMLIILTAAVGVGLVLVVWLAFFRKKQEQEYEYPVSDDEKSSKPDEGGPGEKGERRRRRKRRRVRDHRPRNPTLQQTGGLPPPRSEDKPPPY